MSDFLNQQQRSYLDAMGIQLWEARDVPAADTSAPEAPTELPAETVDGSDRLTLKAERSPVAPPTEAPPTEAPPTEAPLTDKPASPPPVPSLAELDWGALEQCVTECTACEELVANRTRTVFGVGNRQAELLVIGEAPGAEEDQQGEPFVGRAGKLLNAMLKGIGFAREEVYIANVLKCRPPNNRDPAEAEIQACAAFLQRQIELIKPRVILAVGRIAAQNLLHSEAPIGKLRGQLHRHQSGVPLVVTYHPAYLLRSPLEKRKAWLDLCLARRQLQQARERQE